MVRLGLIVPALMLALACCLLLANTAHAATLTVTDLSDSTSDTGSLRYLIAHSNSGDTINFQAGLTGTITLTNGTLSISQDLTIQGPGASSLTISGNNASTVFTVNSGTVTLDSLTITGGSDANFGGGITNLGTLTVSNCTLSGNFGTQGGGIVNGGTLTVSNCTFSGNTANGFGGGIDNAFATATISDSTFSGNSGGTSGQGGGILNYSGTMTVNNCTFSGNSVSGGNGGSIDNRASSTLTVTNSTLSGNSASGSSSSFGGGIFNESSTLTVSNSTLSGNSADFLGGGIYNSAGPVTVSNSTLYGNTAGFGAHGGGGISNDDALTMTNSIVANSGAGGDCSGTITSNGHNLDDDGSCFSGGTDLSNTNPMLGTLQRNGSNTTLQTMLPLPGSPAIHAGDPTQLGGLTTDERGFPRLIGGKLDIGAVQTNYTAVQFLQQPTNTLPNAFISPAVTLDVIETNTSNSTTDAVNGIPITLTFHGTGTLNGTLTQTTTGGVATFNDLAVNATGTNETLSTSVTVVAGTTLMATSSSFNIAVPTPTPAPTLTLTANPSSLSLTDGQSGTVTLTVSGPGNASANIVCYTSGIFCQAGSPNAGTNSTTFTLTFSTVDTLAANRTSAPIHGSNRMAMWFAAPLAMLLLPVARRKRRMKYTLLLGITLGGLLALLGGCGSGETFHGAVPVGTYNATIAASSGGAYGSTNINIIVHR